MSITVILIEKDKYATELGHIENAIMQLRTQEKNGMRNFVAFTPKKTNS